MSETTTPLLIQLDARQRAALERIQREEYPTYSLAAVARHLVADILVRMGVLELPEANRSKGARASARKPR